MKGACSKAFIGSHFAGHSVSESNFVQQERAKETLGCKNLPVNNFIRIYAATFFIVYFELNVSVIFVFVLISTTQSTLCAKNKLRYGIFTHFDRKGKIFRH